MDDRDSELGRRLHDAYERMTPSPEAEERMLANLIAHASGHAPSDEGPSADGDASAGERASADEEHRTARGGTAGRPARRLRKAMLPLAACLVLVAGVGAFAMGGNVQSPLEALRLSSESVRNSSSASDPDAPDATFDPDASDAALEDGSGASPESAEPSVALGSTAGGIDAAPESAADGAGGASDSDARYPFVRLSSGELIRIALGEDGPLPADPALLGSELETAQAFNGAEAQAVPCTVFATTDENHPFAVRFDDGQTFLANPIDGE